jgi:predicted metalloprotease with PDZ domain
MRIYWSGAAMMLEADARLRALTDGEQSLDTALAAFNACCFDPGRRWQAEDIFAQLDQITGYHVFSDVYDEHVPNTEFPDISETYQQLGLEPDKQSIQINPGAPWSRIRYFIMNEPRFNSIQSERPSGSGSP